MKNYSLLNIVSLASAAALMNLSWVADGHISVPSQEGQRCQKGEVKDSGEWIESWMPPPSPLDPLAGGCADCTLSDTIPEYYCESRGTDCDGFPGYLESYEWKRSKFIYQCGQPGQPGYGWFVECTIWAPDECCDDGSQGLPPTTCTHNGAAACASRVVIE